MTSKAGSTNSTGGNENVGEGIHKFGTVLATSQQCRRVLQDSLLQSTPEPSSPMMSKEQELMMSSLLSAPIKLTEVDELTPGKENTILGKAIQSLGLNSPMTPCTTKVPRSRDYVLTPVNSKKRLRQFSMDDSMLEDEPGSKKACQTPSRKADEFDLTSSKRLYRSQSESSVTIKHAMEQKHNDPMLIGDCSRQYVLPLMNGRHHDLKEISGDTLIKLINGEYRVSYTLIDCRYPFEYAGGHIRGAINLYTEAQVHKQFFENKQPNSLGLEPEILIFHCEFSVERGPRMCRSFRDWDRNANLDKFPSLYYPEMYVLYRGYKGFYENHPSYCIPEKYMKMLDDSEQLRFYKSKCKTEVVKSKSKSVPTLKTGRSFTIKKFVI